MTDPVAAKSTFLCMYMSNHPDTLVSYVKHFGKTRDSIITNAKMISIDTKVGSPYLTPTLTVYSWSQGMDLFYQTKSEKNQVRIEFDPPLVGYEEVKPRLLNMKVDAEKSLRMVSGCYARIPRWHWVLYRHPYPE